MRFSVEANVTDMKELEDLLHEARAAGADETARLSADSDKNGTIVIIEWAT